MLIEYYQFSSPTLGQDHLPRPRIVKQLQLYLSDTRCKALIMTAKGGYGKSCAIVELIRETDGRVWVWYPLEKLQRKNISTLFVWNLIRAIQTIRDDFGKQFAVFFEQYSKTDQLAEISNEVLSAILIQIAYDLANIDSKVTIVFDNYHYCHDLQIDSLITSFIDSLPSNIQLIFTTRRKPGWSSSRWEIQETQVTLNETFLCLSESETQALAQAMHVEVDKRIAKMIHKRTAGWMILNKIILRENRNQSSPNLFSLLDNAPNDNEQLYEYLVEDFLLKETSEVRDFLCQTSILSELTPHLCNKLLQIENSHKILVHLKDGLFVDTVQSSMTPSYSHSHDLIREFLQNALIRLYDLQTRNNLYVRLAQIYVEDRDWDSGIAYYCDAGHYADAIKIITQQMPKLLDTAQHTYLATWLQHFPSSVIENEPMLLFCRGLIDAGERNSISVEWFRRASQLFKERGDVPNMLWVQAELGWFYVLTRRYQIGSTTLRSALEEVEKLQLNELRARLLHYLAIGIQGSDDFIEAKETYELARTAYRDIESNESFTALIRLLRQQASYYHIVGDLRQALAALQEAYHLSKSLDLGDWSLGWILNQLADSHRHRGAYDEALAQLDEAERLLGQYRKTGISSVLLNFLLITRGHIHRDRYEYDEASMLYIQAGRKENGVFLAWNLVQPDKRQAALEGAKKYADRKKRTDDSVVVVAQSQGMLGIAYMNMGDYESALDCLQNTVDVAKKKGSIFVHISYSMYLAAACLKKSSPHHTRQLLQFVFKEMSEREYYTLDVWHPWIVAEMCAFALSENIEADFVERLVIKRLSADHLDPLVKLVSLNEKSISRRATHIMQTLGRLNDLEAREILNSHPDQHTRERLQGWLDAGWLTAVGLIKLNEMITLREAEVLLTWICPRLHGSPTAIGSELSISRDTVNTYTRDKIPPKIEEHLKIKFPSGAGAYNKAYVWAIENDIIDPKKSSSC